MPLLLDLSHTSHTRARTGIQRVSRSLYGALAGQCAGVCFDPYEGSWRPLEPWEEENLSAPEPSGGRGSHWPLMARLRGRARHILRRPVGLSALHGAGGAIFPEVFSPDVARALPDIFAATAGPRVALFHDAIALQFPEFAPRSTLARFPGYLQELLKFDGVAAVSETSKASLLGYWRWLGVARVPDVAAIPLGIDAPAPAPSPGPAGNAGAPVILCVGSIEGRKNHAALLDACESLWARDARFELRLVGLSNAETGAAALGKLDRLRAAGRPIRYDGPLGDDALDAGYRGCAFTVYPSLAEGFGLPVAESLARGRPCLCRTDGALGETAAGGGCLSLGSAGAPEIATAIGGLLERPSELASLSAAARGRRFRTWKQYASELVGWMETLRMHE